MVGGDLRAGPAGRYNTGRGCACTHNMLTEIVSRVARPGSDTHPLDELGADAHEWAIWMGDGEGMRVRLRLGMITIALINTPVSCTSLFPVVSGSLFHITFVMDPGCYCRY